MRLLTTFFSIILTTPAFAEAFNRPIPQAQSATAEFWFALGSIALIAALVLVQRLVARK
ncbi:MAG: protein NnrT [Paracoccaceae bacterium]|uniref:protein NnrT n=1 Tax=Seohaeicola saemankumensis TaxID=481181 RepID=UPI001E31E88A|nr:protein NnrT [Seohaeicola saemankumensis]MCD1625674.1 protein NnrT [Seohaeicola saemankumensis]